MLRKRSVLCLLVVFGEVVCASVYAGTPRWDVITEQVTEVADLPSNSPPFWEYHQPIVIRYGEHVYAAITETWGKEFHQKQWQLYQRTEEGNWQNVYASAKDQQLNQPPVLLVDKQGQLHVSVWPEGTFKYLRFDLTGNIDHSTVELPDAGFTNLWPFQGGGVNADGDLLIAMLEFGNPGQVYMFREAATGAWARGNAVTFDSRPESPTGHDRHTYPYVVLKDREAHIFSTQDIEDPEKIAQRASYTFSYRKLDYYYSSDVLNAPFQAVGVLNIEHTEGWLHNDDMLLDSSGKIHLLYWSQTEEGNGRTNSAQIHAFGSPGGPLTHVEIGRPGEFTEGRLWESPGGVIYVALPRHDDLYLAPLAEEGALAETPLSVGISPGRWHTLFAGPRVFLVCSRAVASGAPFLEGLYRTPVGNGRIAIRYFRVTFKSDVEGASPPTEGGPLLAGDFDGNGRVEFSDFLQFAQNFGKKEGDADFDTRFDLNRDGTVNFPDFVQFVQSFGKTTE